MSAEATPADQINAAIVGLTDIATHGGRSRGLLEAASIAIDLCDREYPGSEQFVIHLAGKLQARAKECCNQVVERAEEIT